MLKQFVLEQWHVFREESSGVVEAFCASTAAKEESSAVVEAFCASASSEEGSLGVVEALFFCNTLYVFVSKV